MNAKMKNWNLMIDDLNSKAIRFRLSERKRKTPSFKRYIKTIVSKLPRQIFSSDHTQHFIEEIMANRFTDSKKYDDPWFCDLSPKHKALYLYMLDTCDCAGFWKFNPKLFYTHWEWKLTREDMNALVKKVQIVNEDTYLVTSFVKFQCKKLSENSNVYLGIKKQFDYYNLQVKDYITLSLPLANATARDMDKDKNQDKDKDTDKGKEEIPTAEKKEITPDIVMSLFNEICAEQGKIEKYNSPWLSGNAATDYANRVAMPQYRIVDEWHELFNRVASNRFLCGLDKKVFVATLPWILKPDNFDVIMGGGYPNTRKIKKPQEECPEGVDYDVWIRQQPVKSEFKYDT